MLADGTILIRIPTPFSIKENDKGKIDFFLKNFPFSFAQLKKVLYLQSEKHKIVELLKFRKMETQVFMKDKLLELFGDCFGGAEQTRWAIAHQRIRRVCKATQMIGYLYGSNEETYKMIYRSIDGEITLEKIVDAVNVMIGFEHPKIDKTDTITMESIRSYCRMNEPEFLAEFKRVEGYEYAE